MFDLCLVRGKIFLRPRPFADRRYVGHESYGKPEWQLMLVNHQIRREASKVIFSENSFVLNYNGLEWEKCCIWPRHQLSLSLLILAQRHMRSASISLDVRGLADDTLSLAHVCRADAENRLVNQAWDMMGYEERVMAVHRDFESKATQWDDIFSNMPVLQFLQLDISNCYCPLGCHRLIDEVTMTIELCMDLSEVKEVETLGTKTEVERDRVFPAVASVLRGISKEKRKRVILRFKAFDTGSDLVPTQLLDNYDLEDGLGDEETTLEPGEVVYPEDC